MTMMKTTYTAIDKLNNKGSVIETLDFPKLNSKQFPRFFLKNMVILHKAKGVNYPVFFELAKLMDFENIVRLYQFDKEKISKNTGLKIGAIDAALTRMVKAGLINRVGRGVYFIDPDIVGSGSFKDIVKLRMRFEALSKDRDGVKRVQILKEIDYDMELTS